MKTQIFLIILTAISTCIVTIISQILLNQYNAGSLEYTVNAISFEQNHQQNNNIEYYLKKCITIAQINIQNNSDFNEKNISIIFPEILKEVAQSVSINSSLKNAIIDNDNVLKIKIPELIQKQNTSINLFLENSYCLSQYYFDKILVSSDKTLGELKKPFYEKYKEAIFILTIMIVSFFIFIVSSIVIYILTPYSKKKEDLLKQLSDLEAKYNKEK